MDNRWSVGVYTRSRRLLVALLCLMTAKAMAELLPLKRAVELALNHATTTEIAAAEDNSPMVQAAEERARAQYLKAQGEHKSSLPSVDFAAQYARLSTYNNYDQFFQPHSFQPNNATVGVAIRFPVFNASQRARADAADADAVRAKRQVDAARNQVSEETLKLQRNVHQLEAAQEVAQLELEVASANLDALQSRVDAGTATVRDLGDSRAQVSERFITLQDTMFELERARIGLLQSTGDLENWVRGGN